MFTMENNVLEILKKSLDAFSHRITCIKHISKMQHPFALETDPTQHYKLTIFDLFST